MPKQCTDWCMADSEMDRSQSNALQMLAMNELQLMFLIQQWAWFDTSQDYKFVGTDNG